MAEAEEANIGLQCAVGFLNVEGSIGIQNQSSLVDITLCYVLFFPQFH